jgi:hypothetical protein
VSHNDVIRNMELDESRIHIGMSQGEMGHLAHYRQLTESAMHNEIKKGDTQKKNKTFSLYT